MTKLGRINPCLIKLAKRLPFSSVFLLIRLLSLQGTNVMRIGQNQFQLPL